MALARSAAVALIPPLAWEPPSAVSAALKRQKPKKKKKRERGKERDRRSQKGSRRGEPGRPKISPPLDEDKQTKEWSIDVYRATTS